MQLTFKTILRSVKTIDGIIFWCVHFKLLEKKGGRTYAYGLSCAYCYFMNNQQVFSVQI